MNHEPNELVTLEWLIAPLNEQLNVLHGQADDALAKMSHIIAEYQSIAGVLTMANLPRFADLAKLIHSLFVHVDSTKDTELLSEALFASRLLQHELNHYAITDLVRTEVLDWRVQRLVHLLKVVNPASLGALAEKPFDAHKKFSNKIDLALSNADVPSTSLSELMNDWHMLASSIEVEGDNAEHLAKLYDMTQMLAVQGEGDWQKLWLLTGLWLSNLAFNEVSVSAIELLENLGDEYVWAYDDTQSEQVLALENLFINIYIHLAGFSKHSQTAKDVISDISGHVPDDKAFFPYVLSALEKLIYSISDGNLNQVMLEELQKRLANRGWTFYAAYVEQIVIDVANANQNPEAFSALQWQLSTQLQDLYVMMSDAYQAISSKVGSATAEEVQNKDALREVRVLIEEIKTEFTDYLHSKNVEDLPAQHAFERLIFNFEEMGLPQASELTKKVANLFELLRTHALTKISWQLSYKVADALSSFEMFLDNLAQEILDLSFLGKTSAYIDESVVLLEQTEEDALEVFDIEADLAKEHEAVTVYDDKGEYEPSVATPQADEIDGEDGALTDDGDDGDDNVNTTAPAKPVSNEPLVLGEAYLAIKASLPNDDLSHDEEFREIFIEEADEVLDEMLGNLPKWQADINDFKTLKEIRRNFHTLKGSGRMVGALQLGETAWAIENMLNRVLDGTVAVTPDVAKLVADMADMTPAMVQDFAQGNPPSVDNVSIVLRAGNILAGRAIDEGMYAVATPVVEEMPVAEVVAEAEPEEAEPMLALEVLAPFIEQAKQPLASAVGEVDEDIKEIFIEEADEVLQDIRPKFNQWRLDGDAELLTDVRRGFHTLKGSGRMVGATTLGELAWAVENMFNRIIDKSIVVNDGIKALVFDVLDNFSGLVKIFENESDDYPEKVVLWTASAHAYSRGLGEKFDYRSITNFEAQAEDCPDTANVPAPAQTVDEVHDEYADKLSVTALTSFQEAEALILGAMATTAQNEEEDKLCQIFIEEAKDLLEVVKGFLHAHEHASEVAVSDDVVRVFHTLRGATGLSPFVEIGEVSAMIEHGLQSLQHHDAMMTLSHLQALGNAVGLIEARIQSYQGSAETAYDFEENASDFEAFEAEADNSHNVSLLIEDIDTLLDAELELEEVAGKDREEISIYAQVQLHDIEVLSERTYDLPKFQSLLATLKPAYELMAEHPEEAKDDAFIDALLAIHHQLIGLFDSLAGSMSLRLNKESLARLHNLTTDKVVYYAELGKSIKEQTSDFQISSIRYEVVDTDDELLQIFLEEAGELDTTITNTFAEWRSAPDSLESLKALQRHLHTIKGGARLAGISSIGDLTHEAESVYERFVDGRMVVTPDWLTTMQRVQDVLSLQLDSVKNTKRSFFVDETIEDLHVFLDAGAVPAGQLIRIPVFEDDSKKTAKPAVAVVEEFDEDKQFEQYLLESWGGALPDNDILMVFLEEAKELAESSGEDFSAFRNNTSDVASLQSLQRKLHTIKGGARMVSANGVADLAHEMETVYEMLGSRRRPATRMVANLLFACHDWISNAVGLLSEKLNPTRPTLLIEALQTFVEDPDSLMSVPVVSLEHEAQIVAQYKAYLESSRSTRDISRMPPLKGVFGESVESTANAEMIRVSASLMERMINLSGEAAINRARIDMNMASLTASIEEMGMTVQRLADQLRRMDNELEEQILAQIDDAVMMDVGFDPLEMDQYSSLNQLSKSLSESASDLLDIKATLLEKTRDGENLLLQLSRTQNELQDSLMHSRMVPFSRLTPRLQRIVRQTAGELGKNVDLTVINADGELDRGILEHITSPLEHMLRNAVDHGIESPDRRAELGKPYMGHITLEVLREGSEMIILLSDDGAGVNVQAVRNKAISQGLIREDEELSDNDIMQYIFNAGLSTTNKITQISGRGVGMDVVRTEIRQLGGSVSVESEFGQGSRFIIRVPLMVTVSDALIVRVADRQYAVPLVQIERVAQVDARKLYNYHQSGDLSLDIDGRNYRVRYLNEILSGHHFTEVTNSSLPVILIKTATDQMLALQVDEIVGSRIELVVKPLGRQLSRLSGISAATIMGDGSVMLILDLLALMRMPQARTARTEKKAIDRRRLIMVVDDSVTVRKVTSRFLERQGFDVVVAKDGIDAIETLQDTVPDLMLLDIEMPRMDGFEVATQVRHNPRLQELPIIMITSRTGEKHRERAFEIGVNEYMGKPFQELDLLVNINRLLGLSGEVV